MDILFEDVYVPGSEIPVLRGRISDDSWDFKTRLFEQGLLSRVGNV